MSPKKLALCLSLALVPGIASATTHTVRQMTGRVFSPARLAVAVGDTVVWMNADTMSHTTTSGTSGTSDGRFDSGDMAPGATFSYTFTTAGSFPYFCAYHGNMTGSIDVLQVAATIEERPGRIFVPASVTVNVGDTVLWVNADTMAHTATSGSGTPSGLFASGNMTPGATYAYTFTAAGAVPYYCEYHGNMTGTVTVQGGTPTPIALLAAKAGNDVVLRFTGGAVPYTAYRGSLADLTDLVPRPGPVSSPWTDLAVVGPPPSLLLYQVR